jgi:lipase chaperone LimK
MHHWRTFSHPSRVLSIVFLALLLWLAGCVPVSTQATTRPTATTQPTATATSAYPPLNLHREGSKIPINTVADLCHYSLVADVTVNKPQQIEQGQVTQQKQTIALSEMEQQLAGCK